MRGNARLMTQAVVDYPILFGDLKIGFACITYDIKAPRSICLPHTHDYFEFYIILEGKQYTTINGHEQLNGPGCFFLVPPGVPHSHRYHGDVGDQGVVVRFSLERVPCSVQCLPLAERLIRVLSVPHVTSFVDQQIADILTAEDDSRTLDQLQVTMLNWVVRLYTLLEQDANTCSGHSAPRAMTDRELVNNVIMTINTLYMTDVDVNRLAMMHNISYRHLARIFSRVTDYTLTEWIAFTRVRNAAVLLDETDFSITEISRHVGFHSESYFSNVFSRIVGTSPLRYRRGKLRTHGVVIPMPLALDGCGS